MDKTRIELMEKAPVKVAVIKLAIPTMVAMVVQFVYNLTDTFFIGQTGDPNMVAGISLAAPIFMLTQALGNIFAIGAASYISRKLGERDYAEAEHTSARRHLYSPGPQSHGNGRILSVYETAARRHRHQCGDIRIYTGTIWSLSKPSLPYWFCRSYWRDLSGRRAPPRKQ